MTRSRAYAKAASALDFSSDELAHLSSKQTWECLTNLLYRATLPLARMTTFAFDLVFTILTSTSDQRRKISRYESEDCLNIAYSLLFKSPEAILKTAIFDMGVERWVISNFINNYLNGTYKPQLLEVPDDYYFTPNALYRHVRDFYQVYIDFRRRVCERFIKLSNSQAAKSAWQKGQFGINAEQHDTENNFFLSVVRAIDKLYPSKGTLGNYVLQWLGNSSGSSFAIYTGEAFNLTRPTRKQIHEGTLHVNNKAYSLDDAMNIPAPEELNISMEEHSTLLQTLADVQSIPANSLILLLHGFKQVPTPKLQRQINRHILQIEQLSTPVNLSTPDIEDLPVILPLSRSSRKNTETQRRRKEILRMRKEQ